MTEKKSVSKIPEYKIKNVKELEELIKNKKTILIASIKNLPASQFQEISKKLRNKAIVKVPKKNLIVRALNSSEKDSIKKLGEQIKDSVAILFSDMDAFELASELINSKSPANAKAGQEAPEDIEVQEGPTDLIPGPAVSELGSLGIQIQIEKGKISIKQSKVIVKAGGKISAGAADIMNKLDIKPFSVGFIPLCAFDNEEGKFYPEFSIDKEGTLAELKKAYGKALPFAVEIGYATPKTITFLVGKAGAHGKVLEKIAEADTSENKEVVNEKNKESDEEKEVNEADNLTNENKSERGGERVNVPSGGGRDAVDNELKEKEETNNQTSENKSEEEK